MAHDTGRRSSPASQGLPVLRLVLGENDPQKRYCIRRSSTVLGCGCSTVVFGWHWSKKGG